VVGNRTYLCGDDILKSEMTVTDIINHYLTKIGVARTKREGNMSNLWEVRIFPNGDFEVVYLS